MKLRVTRAREKSDEHVVVIDADALETAVVKRLFERLHISLAAFILHSVQVCCYSFLVGRRKYSPSG